MTLFAFLSSFPADFTMRFRRGLMIESRNTILQQLLELAPSAAAKGQWGMGAMGAGAMGAMG
ncbi:MAG: hypothetical protein J2P21_23655, partial [Chloracidobacterium sp.]|nr:hypothetical protein [Chloracidobacterium sp.]